MNGARFVSPDSLRFGSAGNDEVVSVVLTSKSELMLVGHTTGRVAPCVQKDARGCGGGWDVFYLNVFANFDGMDGRRAEVFARLGIKKDFTPKVTDSGLVLGWTDCTSFPGRHALQSSASGGFVVSQRTNEWRTDGDDDTFNPTHIRPDVCMYLSAAYLVCMYLSLLLG